MKPYIESIDDPQTVGGLTAYFGGQEVTLESVTWSTSVECHFNPATQEYEKGRRICCGAMVGLQALNLRSLACYQAGDLVVLGTNESGETAVCWLEDLTIHQTLYDGDTWAYSFTCRAIHPWRAANALV